MNKFQEDLSELISAHVQTRKVRQNARITFALGWLEKKEQIRRLFQTTVKQLSDKNIPPCISNWNGNISLGIGCDHMLEFVKNPVGASVFIRSPHHEEEAFSLENLTDEEITCRIIRFVDDYFIHC